MKCLLQCTICPASSTSVFTGLSQKQLKALESYQTANTYKKQQVVFYEGNPALGVYCISEGKVKIYKTSDDGKQRIFRICMQGDLLGYASLFGNRPEQYTAEALEDSKVCFLEKNGFLDFLRKNSDVTMAVLARLSRESIRSHEQTMDQTFKSVRRRLAEFLIHLEGSFGVREEKKGTSAIYLTLTREELAQAIGTTVETTVRLLSEFKKDGILTEEDHKIVILAPTRLSALSSSAF